jgi:phage tail sheath protein FI
MANLTYPGVYVEEVSSGIRPIQAAGTSTAAFIGIAEKGSLNEAVKIFNFTEYQNLYGGFLNSSFLSHSVYQFFNNGGSQCYIIRVGANLQTANIVLNDRGGTAQTSLTISAKSPGIWGNQLAVKITDGSNDPANEFNLLVYRQDAITPSDLTKATLLERFENLSMVPGSANFVTTRTSASKQIEITVHANNANVQAGSSLGAGAPLALTIPERKKFRINIDGDGYQEVDLQTAVGGGSGQVANLNSSANIASAIAFVIKRLTKLRASTKQTAFSNFTCAESGGLLLLTSGASGLASSVTFAPAINSGEDASGLLKLGKLNGGTETIGAAVTRPQVTPTENLYFVGDNAAPTNQVVSIQAGSDGDMVTNDQPFIAALQILNNIEDVSLIAIPGIGSEAIVGAGMNYCANNRSLSDCFFIGDMRQDNDTVAEAEIFVAAVSPKNSYGAVYAPWVKMLDPTGISPEPILVPPSGFVAGLYAKTDAQRGVWKAPAGVNVGLGGAVGLAVNFTDVQQGNLNNKNINGIRQFASSGIVLWGARTLSADAEWKYIPVRRMAIFLRVSIYRGIQSAVFEPNDEPLWSQLRLNIGSFMTGLFRRGAFQGATPSQAFFVKCDGETTTQDDINLGIVNVLVGFAPLKPAEFIVVKISQKAGQSS